MYIYYALDEHVVDPELLGHYHALLDAEERARHAAFKFERDRHRYLVAHALLRTSLSRHAPIAPQAWQFERGREGKPAVPGSPLQFSLSHTSGLSCCAIAEVEVGCDAEDTDKAVEDGVARIACSPVERARLAALPAAHRRERFFLYWTLKEAYVKARGSGLAMPLDQLTLDVGDPIRIAVAAELDDGAPWSFAIHRPTARHLIACAVPSAAPPVLEVLRVVPLVD